MRILIFTHHILSGNSGGSFASRAYINAFCTISSACRLLYPENGKTLKNFISDAVELKGIQNRKWGLGKLVDIYAGRINRYSKVIFDEIQDFQPDFIVFDNSRSSAGYIRKVKELGLRVITIHHNYEMEYYKGTKPSLLWRHSFLYYMEKAERDAVLYSDLNLTLTNQDIQLLQTCYDTRSITKFACTGMFEYKPSFYGKKQNFAIAAGHSADLTFAITGSLDSHQTTISLIPFLKEYYPLLIKRYPKSKLIVAGKNPSAEIRQLCNHYPSVKLIANPVNMQILLEKSSIYICPTSVGGGLKLRIMDGLKAGLPILAHCVSARGYDHFKKMGVLIDYWDVQSFEDGLESIIRNVKSKDDISSMYSSMFSFENGKNRLIKTIENHFGKM